MTAGTRVGFASFCAAAALMAPAAASAAVKTYGGNISPKGTVAMDVKVSKKGVAKKVIAIRAQGVLAHCDTSGDIDISININRDNAVNPDGSPFGIKVKPNGKFSLDYTEPTYHQRKYIFGQFNGPNDKKVAGGFTYANHYPADAKYPEENCHTDDDTYTGKAGGPDVVIPPAV